MADDTHAPALPKTCRLCGEQKTRSDFGENLRMTDGLKAECRTCLNAKMAARRELQRANDPQRQARLADEKRRAELGLKVCGKCRRELPVGEFFRCQDRPDGLASQCRDCKSKYATALHAKNLIADRARLSAWQKAWRKSSTERLAYERKWRAENREKTRAQRLERNKKNPFAEREKFIRRRAIKAGATVGEIDNALLWVRQCGICALCGEQIDPTLVYPHPQSKSIDHVIPLSRGGEHSQRNITWTHLFCNWSKGARLPETA